MKRALVNWLLVVLVLGGAVAAGCGELPDTVGQTSWVFCIGPMDACPYRSDAGVQRRMEGGSDASVDSVGR